MAKSCTHTVLKIDCSANIDQASSPGSVPDIDYDTAQIKLPPPTAFRRQKNKTGFMNRLNGGAKLDHTRTDITLSHAFSQRKLMCTETVQSTKEEARAALNHEEWRQVFEQCCK
jgi:hypothetical protein